MPVSTPDAARRERNRRLAITTGILVLLALVIATGVWVTSGSSTPDPAAAKTPAAHAGDHSLVVGAATAPVKVVVYEDFLCPFCRQLETSTRDFLHQDAAKGRVQVEYRPFQLLPDDYSRRALDACIRALADLDVAPSDPTVDLIAALAGTAVQPSAAP